MSDWRVLVAELQDFLGPEAGVEGASYFCCRLVTEALEVASLVGRTGDGHGGGIGHY